jgi:hypothetical protein
MDPGEAGVGGGPAAQTKRLGGLTLERAHSVFPVALDPIVHGETPHGMAAQPGGAVAAGGVLGRVTRWVVSHGFALERKYSAPAPRKGGIEDSSHQSARQTWAKPTFKMVGNRCLPPPATVSAFRPASPISRMVQKQPGKIENPDLASTPMHISRLNKKSKKHLVSL